MHKTSLLFLLCLAGPGCIHASPSRYLERDFRSPKERYFKKVRQLTFEGTNLKPHWSFDGRWISFQHKRADLHRENIPCEQVFKIKADGSKMIPLSNGRGKAVDVTFLRRDKRVLFSSTEALQQTCKEEPTHGKYAHRKHVKEELWYLNPLFQFYGVFPDGSDPLPLEPGAPTTYNAEAATCHDGSVIFTSVRGGKVRLYRATLDSFNSFQDIKPISGSLGYQGGVSFSPDCKKIVWHAFHPQRSLEIERYENLLKDHFVPVSKLEIWMANADGSNPHPITELGSQSYAPVFTPDGQAILFTSHYPKSTKNDGGTNLYLIQIDGTGLEKISDSGNFNGFASFSPQGKHLVFSSQRGSGSPEERNLFVAEWESPKNAPETGNHH